MSLGKSWCFTLNNPVAADHEHLAALDCVYLVYGDELAPTSGTPHLQGYVVFSTNKRLSAVKKLMSSRYHLELAKGTAQENYDYCTKDGWVTERGDRPLSRAGVGLKNKERWLDVIRAAKEGTAQEEYPREFLQYNSTILKLYTPALADLDHYCGLWYTGPPGTGKSRSARKEYPGSYDKLLNKWWDGYEGEESVLIDDIGLDNKLMGTFLKRYVDHYPFRAEFKGGSKLIRPKTVIVTSNYTIQQIWPDDLQLQEALMRRFKVVHFHGMFK